MRQAKDTDSELERYTRKSQILHEMTHQEASLRIAIPVSFPLTVAPQGETNCETRQHADVLFALFDKYPYIDQMKAEIRRNVRGFFPIFLRRLKSTNPKLLQLIVQNRHSLAMYLSDS